MKVLFLYQDIDSGAKVATEAIIAKLKISHPRDKYYVYKQPAEHFRGNFSYLKNFLWSIKDYRQIINSYEVDVIYSVMFTSSIARIFSKNKKVPLVFHFHGDQEFGKFKIMKKLDHIKYLYHKFLNEFIITIQKFALTSSEKIIFVSNESSIQIQKKYCLSIGHKVYIIANGVDTSRFKKISLEKESRLKKNFQIDKKKVIAYIGRMDEKKGIRNLIEAFSLLNSFHLVLIIAYPKPLDAISISYLNELKKLTYNLNVNEKVLLIEGFPRLEQIYQISDIVVLPSIQEMFPLVMLESFSSGGIFLGTKINGIQSFLKKIDKRLILNDNSPKEIADKIDYFLQLSQKNKDKIIKKANLLISDFTWDSTADKIHKLFKTFTLFDI